jgi:hypothetical protein
MELLNVSLRCKSLSTFNFIVYQQILFSTLHETETKVSQFSSAWVVAQSGIRIAAGASYFSAPNYQTGPGADSAVCSKFIRVLTGRGVGKGTGSYNYSQPSSVEIKTVAP